MLRMGSSNSARRGAMEDEMDLDDPTVSETYMAALLRSFIRNNGQVRILTSDSSSWGSDDDADLEEDMHPEIAEIARADLASNNKQAEMTSVICQASNPPCVELDNLPVSSAKKRGVIEMMTQRETGMNGSQHFTSADKRSMYSRFLPNDGEILTQYHHKIFCGTYSSDGDLFLTASQDRNIRLYNTGNSSLEMCKVLQARDVGWSVLDTAFSPDGTHLIYSSWSECVHLCNIFGENERHEALLFCPDDRRFCIFSVTFSQDGNEILGGANDGCIYVYDVKCNQRNLKISSHDDDVNTVAFVDASSQILFSGGDDGLCKVWDRRTLNETSPKPVGILAGHRDGITFVDPRGDGRHLITNSKDQSIKLWDMRKFSSKAGVENTKRAVASRHWDYRRCLPRKFSVPNSKPLVGDTSLMTYAGHTVLQTLIRCRFSPAFTTGQRFIYTGCTTGQVIIYDVLTGNIVKKLKKHNECVRDVSWHPYKPELISTSWDCSVIHWEYREDLSEDQDVEPNVHQTGDNDEDLKGSRLQTWRRRRYNLRRAPCTLE